MPIVYDPVTGDIDEQATRKSEDQAGLGMFVLICGLLVAGWLIAQT